MDGDGKKPLRIIIITDFYKLHESKGKAQKFMKFGVHKTTIYKWFSKY